VSLPIIPREESAILRLDLVERLPAYEFSRLVESIFDLYFGHLWLRLADEAPSGQGPSDPYAPREEENLYLERAEIGTPNLIHLAGLALDLIPTFGTLGLILKLGGAGKVSASIVKDVAAARKATAETRKIEVETKLLELDLEERARKLERRRRATPKQVKHKAELQESAVSTLRALSPLIVGEPRLILVSQRLISQAPEPNPA
jgi:hypothetical protein